MSAAATPAAAASPSSSTPRLVTASELAALLLDSASAPLTLVVDVRDDDFAGGHIAGALNIPSEEFDDRLDDVLQASEGKTLVVVHCAFSQIRGPKAARKLAQHVEKNNIVCPPIAVLEQGFRGWAKYVSKLDAAEKAKHKSKLIADYDAATHGHKI